MNRGLIAIGLIGSLLATASIFAPWLSVTGSRFQMTWGSGLLSWSVPEPKGEFTEITVSPSPWEIVKAQGVNKATALPTLAVVGAVLASVSALALLLFPSSTVSKGGLIIGGFFVFLPALGFVLIPLLASPPYPGDITSVNLSYGSVLALIGSFLVFGGSKGAKTGVEKPFGETETSYGGEGNICSECGEKNREDAMFCTNCGTELIEKSAPEVCPNCGSEIEAEAKFCVECGEKLKE